MYKERKRDSDCERGRATERIRERGQLKEQSDLWQCEGEIDGCLTSGLLKMAEQSFMVQERK